MGVEGDLVPAQPSDEELRIGARIAGLAQNPSDEARARIMAAVRSTTMPTHTMMTMAGSHFPPVLVCYLWR